MHTTLTPTIRTIMRVSTTTAAGTRPTPPRGTARTRGTTYALQICLGLENCEICVAELAYP